MDVGACISGGTALLFGVVHDAGDPLILWLIRSTREGESRQQHLTLEPLIQGWLCRHIENGGHRGDEVLFAGVTQGGVALFAIGTDDGVPRHAVPGVPVI